MNTRRKAKILLGSSQNVTYLKLNSGTQNSLISVPNYLQKIKQPGASLDFSSHLSPQPLQWGCKDLRMLFKEVTGPPSGQRGRDWHPSAMVWAPLIRPGGNELGDLTRAPARPRASYLSLLCFPFLLHSWAAVVYC